MIEHLVENALLMIEKIVFDARRQSLKASTAETGHTSIQLRTAAIGCWYALSPAAKIESDGEKVSPSSGNSIFLYISVSLSTIRDPSVIVTARICRAFMARFALFPKAKEKFFQIVRKEL